ncbi:hypothetical protein CEW89_08575 [Celeribacter ethanolicus]|uniref:Uncharacterized protein n=1 Tax=Celeribacter ethanolicus TaxID=1758178 RepID=A0A291GAQ9_9RHOB|nr:hypothetical protein [Celeribacter ethanolicus]ATG47623.1 hypothetical protein CEW89_08575 [Celeribacter ethanolicus]
MNISQAALDVLAERKRQIEVEGWTPEHDDEHDLFELSRAAACYAMLAAGYQPDNAMIRKLWPFSDEWLKPSDTRRRDLVKATAMLIADIERIDRAEGDNDGWQDNRGRIPDCD